MCLVIISCPGLSFVKCVNKFVCGGEGLGGGENIIPIFKRFQKFPNIFIENGTK